MNKIKYSVLMYAMLVVVLPVAAVEIEGVNLEDRIQLEKHVLVLNGAGVRKKLGFKGFVGALYLEKKTKSAEIALEDTGAKRMAYVMLRDVSGQTMLNRINEAIVANNSLEDMKQLEARFARMEKIFTDMKELKTGETIHMDYLPGTGTRIAVNGAVKGTIEGEDFYRSILRNWIGPKPVQTSLKRSVLGQE